MKHLKANPEPTTKAAWARGDGLMESPNPDTSSVAHALPCKPRSNHLLLDNWPDLQAAKSLSHSMSGPFSEPDEADDAAGSMKMVTSLQRNGFEDFDRCGWLIIAVCLHIAQPAGGRPPVRTGSL